MIRKFRSFLTCLRVAGLFGRATKLRDSGRKEEALLLGHRVLEILSSHWVIRNRPYEGSILLNATMLVEQIAYELKQNGANENDIEDALTFLKSLPNDGSSKETSGDEEWLLYLESKLNKTRS